MNEHRDIISDFEQLESKPKEQPIASNQKSLQSLHMVIDASAAQLVKAGNFSKEEGERARKFLKRDLAATQARASECMNNGLNWRRG